MKERFTLRAQNVVGFLRGEYTVQHAEAAMRAQDKTDGEVASMVLLFGEIYTAISTRGLVPAIRTQYMRLAWQSDADATVRVSLDTQLSMLLENPAIGPSTLTSGRWFRDPLAPLMPDEVTWFPHAVLELKLAAVDEYQEPEAPEWVAELLQAAGHEVYKFSKFVHGTATLLPGNIAQVPYWMDDPSILRSVTASHSPHQAAQAAHRDTAQGGDNGGAAAVSEHPLRPGQGDGPVLMDRVDSFPLLGHSQRQGVCGDGCCGVSCKTLEGGRFCCWGGHAAETLQRQRPIRVEPKVFFANERTFLSWVHMAVIMGSIGGALLGMASKGGDSGAPTTITKTTDGHTTVTIVTKVQHVSESGETIGVMMICTAICFVLYASFTYYWRARKIRVSPLRNPIAT